MCSIKVTRYCQGAAVGKVVCQILLKCSLLTLQTAFAPGVTASLTGIFLNIHFLKQFSVHNLSLFLIINNTQRTHGLIIPSRSHRHLTLANNERDQYAQHLQLDSLEIKNFNITSSLRHQRHCISHWDLVKYPFSQAISRPQSVGKIMVSLFLMINNTQRTHGL